MRKPLDTLYLELGERVAYYVLKKETGTSADRWR